PDKKEEGTGGQEPQSERAEGARPDIEATEVRLADGKVSFADEGTEQPFAAAVRDLNVVVRHFSTIPAKPSAVEVSLTTEAGEKVTHTGQPTLRAPALAGAGGRPPPPPESHAPHFAQRPVFTI